MKACQFKLCTLIIVVFILTVLSGCQYEGPSSSLDELNKREEIVPQIIRVLPEEAGTASEITIIGILFSTDPDENWVYFDDIEAIVKSCTDTSIVVYRPDMVGDSVTVKVTVLNAAAVAVYFPYKMESVVEDFGSFASADAILAAGVDQFENVYLAMNTNNVIRLNSDGIRDVAYLGKTAYNLWTDMKMGSDGYIYMARSNNVIYRFSSEESDTAIQYIKLPDRNTDRVQSIDFDENGHLFGGGIGSDLIVIRSDTDFEKMGYYAGQDIISVRVYKGYVYVVVENGSIGIYRHEIHSDGTVGNQELVIDWNSSPYADVIVNDMTFSENDILYIATDCEGSPIIMYNLNDKSFQSLFYGLLSAPVDQLIWGNSTFVYALINRATRKENGGQFLRVNTGETGAPYYGR